MREKKKAPEVSKKSLATFMRDKARAKCAVCQLPKEIRAQLGPAASDKGYTRRDQLEWLRGAYSLTSLTADILNKHLSAQHDREEDFNAPEQG
jgi:hypothetical protein